jgi:hypothetical protein
VIEVLLRMGMDNMYLLSNCAQRIAVAIERLSMGLVFVEMVSTERCARKFAQEDGLRRAQIMERVLTGSMGMGHVNAIQGMEWKHVLLNVQEVPQTSVMDMAIAMTHYMEI